MKHVIILPDGAADEPLDVLGGRTPLEVAPIPHMNSIARGGELGRVCTVPRGFTPATDVATMTLFGFDPVRHYTGRAPIEAIARGLTARSGELIWRCNFVTIADGRMKDFTAGHIAQADANSLIAALNDGLNREGCRFFSGVSYRNLMFLEDAATLDLRCTPPHDIPNQPIIKHIPRGEGARTLNDLMIRSEEVLRNHPVNKQRIAEGKEPATTIWLFWGGQQSAGIPPFATVYGKKAAMTSGVDLLRGIADMAGIENLKIPGVTGGLDTDYAA